MSNMIKDSKGNVIGYVNKNCHGESVSDRNNNYKGHYNTKSNITFSKDGRQTKGNQLLRLI
jgi:hypothetical protein